MTGMTGIPLLTDIVIILALSLGVVVLFHRIRVPPVVGFFLTGILAGPHGLGLIQAVHEVEVLAEVGVVLLLFVIGMEFSLESLLRMGRTLVLGGPIQLVLTGGAGLALGLLLGTGAGEALFLGFLLALSSTAIVLRLIQQRGELDTPHGRTALGILIFQDLAVVPMMLLLPVLAGRAEGPGAALLLLARAAAVLAAVFFAARFLVPFLLRQVVRTRSRELFLLAVVAVGLGVAWLVSAAGLSLALGAFLAGLVVSESEYSHQAVSDVIPFRDVFTSFFFVSLGMLLSPTFLLDHWLVLPAVVAGVLALKTAAAGAAALVVGYPLRTALLAGLSLSQVGEFSFILAESGLDLGLLDEALHPWFLGVAVLSMAATPFLLEAAPRLVEVAESLPVLSRWARRSLVAPPDAVAPPSDHVIVVGFGLNGRNVARACRVAGVPYVCIEINPETVRKERAEGLPIQYGDATQPTVLENAGIGAARVVVVAISDAAATRRITALARSLNAPIHIIARTRYLQETEALLYAGADEVIPEELETSVEIVSRILAHYLVPRREIESFVTEIRADAYAMFRSLGLGGATGAELGMGLPDVEVATLRVAAGSELAGLTLAESDLRGLYGVTVVAVRREGTIEPNPGGDSRVEAGDILVLLGLPEELRAAETLFAAPEGGATPPEGGASPEEGEKSSSAGTSG